MGIQINILSEKWMETKGRNILFIKQHWNSVKFKEAKHELKLIYLKPNERKMKTKIYTSTLYLVKNWNLVNQMN